MKEIQPTRTIARAFEEFLTDQKARISHRTFLKYRSVIDLYKSYMENYWPGHPGEHDSVTKAGGTFCDSFGPEDATSGYSEFLGYYMPRKVMCGQEKMQAAGTVTKKLAKWLVEKGYIRDTEDSQRQAGKAAKDLPKARKVLDLLDRFLQASSLEREVNGIQDHFWIERTEPGKLWLKPLTAGALVIGPVPVPEQVTQLCRPGWDIGGAVVKASDSWRFIEVWNVSP